MGEKQIRLDEGVLDETPNNLSKSEKDNYNESSNHKLELLRKRILNELDCPLKVTTHNLVFGKGNPCAKIMFIGEAPGENEDLQGIPFVGAAGKQLDKLLSLIGLTLDDVYIANILKYRPPNNRDPTNEEIERHTPFLVEQIKIIKPRIVATLGNYSTKFVLANFNVEGMKKIGGISFLHGKHVEKEIDDLKFVVVPLYHPAAMLYKPSIRTDLETDFLGMKSIIEDKREEKKE